MTDNKWQERATKWNKRAEKCDKLGKDMNNIGKKLTLMFTLPFLLLIFFGIPGLIIGVVIALVVLCS
ncbi:spore germination protein [Clostridium niameyense]|uniref:Spore germination protein n=1 Tax=Clostridium niameyense TaxID=1622073 RepID=A0A6M0RCE2_9CLOT|nr:spore germination protein [Clostridium niameyense]NEZ47926.1 spore germination protein [Clostridium niameyense]